MDKITTSTAVIAVDGDGIVHLKILDGSHVELHNATENYNAIAQLVGNNRVLLLVDGRVKFKLSKEAKEYAAGNNVNLKRVATAFVVNSISGRIIAGFYILFNKPIVPTRIFTSQQKALNWLQSFYILPGEPFKKLSN